MASRAALAFLSPVGGVAAQVRSFAVSRIPDAPRSGRQRVTGRARVTMKTVATPPEPGASVLYVKAGEDGKCLGDCPFSMKANLALKIKGLETDVRMIDLSDKPDWYLELNPAGSTPTYVSKSGEVVDSSDEIVALADEEGPEKNSKLYQESNPHWEATAEVIGPVFGAFARLMKNKDESLAEEKSTELTASLKAVNDHLAKVGGPYLLGAEVSAMDCNLAPKIHHILVAGKELKGYEIPQDFTDLLQYYEAMSSRPEWPSTLCPNDTVLWGWSKYL